MSRPPPSILLPLLLALACGCASSRALRAPAATETGTVRGTVSWQAETVPCASVSHEGMRRRARTDFRGAFVLPGLPAGEQWLVVRSRVAPDHRLRVLVHAGETTFVHANLDAAERRAAAAVEDSSEERAAFACFIGSVRDASGERVPFANLFLPRARLWTTCDGEGFFGMSGIPPGEWEVHVQAPGLPAATEHIVIHGRGTLSRDFRLPWNQPERLRMEAPHRGLDASDDAQGPWSPRRAGVMLLPQLGNECTGAVDTLTAQIAGQRDEKRGPAGRFELSVPDRCPWCVCSAYYAHAGDHLVRMSLVDAGGAVVWAVGPPTVSPDSEVIGWDRALSDEVTAPAGVYRVRFETSAGADSIPFCLRWMRVRPTALAASSTTAAGGTAGGTVVGTVRDVAGRPRPFADVILLGTRRGAQCDEQGRFRIERVPAGSYTLRVMALGYEDVSRPVEVKPGGFSHANLVVSPRKVGHEEEVHVHVRR